MKKLYIGLLLSTQIICAAQQPQMPVQTTYEQDIHHMTTSLTASLSQKELEQEIKNLQTKQQEINCSIDTIKNNCQNLDNIVKTLKATALPYYDQAWMVESSRQFNQSNTIKAQRALDKFLALDPTEQKKHADESQLEGVRTVQDIINYWNSQINNGQAIFEYNKQQILHTINNDKRYTLSEIAQHNFNKNYMSKQKKQLINYQSQYNNLTTKYLAALQDNIANEKLLLQAKILQEAQKLQAEKELRLITEKQEQLRLQEEQKETQRKKNQQLLALQREQNLKKSADLATEKQEQLRLQEEQKEAQRKKNQQLLALQREQNLKKSADKEIVQKNRAAAQQEKAKIENAKKTALALAAAKKDAEDLQILHIIASNVSTTDPMQSLQNQLTTYAEELAGKNKGPQDIAEMKSLRNLSRTLSFQKNLDVKLHEYVTSLAINTTADKNSENLISQFKENQKLEKAAHQIEVDSILELLHEYKNLIANRTNINVQRIAEIKELLIHKNAYLQQFNDNLQNFIACDHPLFLDILDYSDYWQNKLHHLDKSNVEQNLSTTANTIKELQESINNCSIDEVPNLQGRLSAEETIYEKLLGTKNVIHFIEIINFFQGDNGLLNPSKLFGEADMNEFKYPHTFQHLSTESLKQIKESLKKTIATETTIEGMVHKLIVIMDSSMEQLEMFPNNRLMIASKYIQDAFKAKSLITINNKNAAKELSAHFFKTFLQENQSDGSLYSRNQIADLATIQTWLMMAFYEISPKN